MIHHCELCGAEERETAQAVELDGEDVIEPEVKLHEYYGHRFCAECFVCLLRDVVERISEWSPEDANDAITAIVIDYTDQAARLRHHRAIERCARNYYKGVV